MARSQAGQGERRTIDEKRLAYINACRIGNSTSNRVSWRMSGIADIIQ